VALRDEGVPGKLTETIFRVPPLADHARHVTAVCLAQFPYPARLLPKCGSNGFLYAYRLTYPDAFLPAILPELMAKAEERPEAALMQ
jgi:hypothetical protein